MTALCFVDIETTGLDIDRHEIYEIGLIRRDEDGSEQTFRWWLPVDLSRADIIALNIGRYHERAPKLGATSGVRPWDAEKGSWRSSIPVSKAVEGFSRLTWDAHLVGAVPSFDAARLERWLRINGQAAGWHYHIIDVEALVAGKLGVRPPWDSKELSRLVDVDPERFEAHTAIGDCLWAAALYDAVMA